MRIVVADVNVSWIVLNVSSDNADPTSELALNEVSDVYHSFSSFVRSAFAYRGFLPLSIM